MTAAFLICQTMLWLALSYLFLSSRKASVFHPYAFYLAFHGVVFVIRPTLEYVFDFQSVFYAMKFFPTDEEIQFTLVLTSFALIVFAMAISFVDAGWPNFGRVLSSGFSGTEWTAFWILTILIGPIAAYSAYAGVAHAAFGDPMIQMDRDPLTGVAVFTNTTGYFAVAQETFGTLCLMFIWGNRFRFWSFVPLFAYFGLRIYVGWGRWTIVLTLMALGLLYLLRHGQRWVPVRFIVFAIPVFFLFHQLGQNRDAFKGWFEAGTTYDEAITSGKSWIEKQDTPDFANFDFLTYVVDVVPDKSGTYTYFLDFLQIFTEPIPRILWPDKPFGPPIKLVELNDYGNFTGWTLSLVGMGWMSGGWLGVAILMMIVGVITARLHRWFWSSEASNFKVLAYCIFAPLTLQWYRDGDISIAKFVFIMIGPLWLWMVIQKLLHAARNPLATIEHRRAIVGRELGRPGHRL